MIGNNQMTILVNEVEKVIKINPQEGWDTFQITQKQLAQAESRKQVIITNLALKIAKAQLKAIDATPPSPVPN
jgi:F0F1-type ATP synthase epsilon subunit